ncbi:helix-turn-helix domain-containing protein [Bifidobacterium imperatoris]|uniref:Helix-turn-helix domain-containing protein n=1 Tax=Bifidobacterium imperatoris TaxID=2020965 RepID=A0A2N5IQW5_9BIFI|nr:helix-turn-helix domain-containing protein [Bifidobacterium imperatoris]PLS24350.1 transcriptional regulator, MerR family [Bifidobacterium imperatoris]QSY56948.1 helix-turn-helix domain-containing protein [Bifidobacterium imperatoris]
MGEYMTTVEVADLLGVKPDTVRKWRQSVGMGPKWTRWPGSRLVRYERSEVERWKHAGKEG